MSQKFRLNFVQQNNSIDFFFLSAIVYLFCALISEYIETLNCLNFSKNWKNGGVLKFLSGSVAGTKFEYFHISRMSLVKELVTVALLETLHSIVFPIADVD